MPGLELEASPSSSPVPFAAEATSAVDATSIGVEADATADTQALARDAISAPTTSDERPTSASSSTSRIRVPSAQRMTMHDDGTQGDEAALATDMDIPVDNAEPQAPLEVSTDSSQLPELAERAPLSMVSDASIAPEVESVEQEIISDARTDAQQPNEAPASAPAPDSSPEQSAFVHATVLVAPASDVAVRGTHNAALLRAHTLRSSATKQLRVNRDALDPASALAGTRYTHELCAIVSLSLSLIGFFY